jgi:ActR/RegA family two-component response regulator/DNA-binding CsgD family transcriptional regulator
MPNWGGPQYSSANRWVLLAEDHQPMLRAMAREARHRHLEVLTASTVAETYCALDSFRPNQLRGVLLDLKLRDGWSFEVVQRTARDFPKAAIAVWTAYAHQRAAVEAFGVKMIDKGDARALQAFWDRTVIAASQGELSIPEAVTLVCSRFALTGNALELVTIAAGGLSSAELAAELEIGRRTLESRLRRLPPGAPHSVDALARLILRVAHDGPSTLEEPLRPDQPTPDLAG